MASDRRLEELIDRLDRRSLDLPVGEHWTVAATLAHLAFWDRFVLERWRDAARNGLLTPRDVQIPADYINDALTPLLLSIPADRAAQHALEAAREVDELTAALSEEAVEEIKAQDRPRLIDRSLHRDPHLDEIESVLSGNGAS